MPTALRPASPTRHALALLASLAALPPMLLADDCVPSPEDGIFCGEEPPSFEAFWVHDHYIHGDTTEYWNGTGGDVSSAFSYDRWGHPSGYYIYNLTAGSRLTITGTDGLRHRGVIQGAGSLRILSGSLRFDPTNSEVYTSLVSGITYRSYNTYAGGTEIAGGRLQIYDDASLGTGALSLSGAGVLQTLQAGSFRGFSITGDAATLQTDADITLSGTISGDGRFNKAGPGTATLSVANTHAGGTSILAGALSISADDRLGAADTALTLGDGAALVASAGFASSRRELVLSGSTGSVRVTNANDTVTWNGATSGPGKLVKQGAGTLTLAGGVGHAGGARIEAGTLEVAVSSTLGGTGAATWSGPIIGAGHFAKSGAGTLVLSGAATHTGYTTVQGGTLKTAAADVLSPSSALFVIRGATVVLDGHDQTVGDLDSWDFAAATTSPGTVELGGATLTNLNRVINNWAGTLAGNGTFVKKGSATMYWSGANTFAGTFRIDDGIVSTETVRTLSPNAVVQIAAGANLKLNDHSQTAAGLSGSGEIALGSAALTLDQTTDTTFSGQISGTGGALVKIGSGTLTLSGENDFTGDLYLFGGTVRVAADSALGFSNGRLQFNNGGALETTAALTSARPITLVGAGTLRTAADTELSGTVSGSGSLTKAGDSTLTLSGDNTYSGGTVVQAGTLRAGHVNAFGSGGVEIGGGTVDFAGFAIANPIVTRGGTLTGLANYVGTQTIAGAVSFSGTVGGSLEVAPAAALNTTGATFTGPVTVQSGGMLSGIGTLGTVTVAAGGTLSPGNSPGLLTIGDGSTLFGTTVIELGGLDRGSGYDAIDVLGPVDGLGSVTVGGTLSVVFWNGWTPTGEASFQIFRASSIGGTFAQIELPALASGYEWNSSRLLSSGYLDLVAAIPEPASASALAGLAFLGLTGLRRRRPARRA